LDRLRCRERARGERDLVPVGRRVGLRLCDAAQRHGPWMHLAQQLELDRACTRAEALLERLERAGVLRRECEQPPRGLRRAERDVEQPQERELRRLRDLIEAEEQVLAEEREQLDQRDSWIAGV